METQQPWHVLLICGASGVGKTRVSYPLARHFGVGITEVDDFQVVLERMTTAAQYPVLHLFRTDPDAFFALDDAGKLDVAIAYTTVMADALEAVIANHLDGGPPLVLEGDFLLPSLAVRDAYAGIPAAGRVRGFILYEDEVQIARNYLAREGEPQPDRARWSWNHSEWLRREAKRLGLPTLAARPWETAVARTLDLLDESYGPASGLGGGT